MMGGSTAPAPADEISPQTQQLVEETLQALQRDVNVLSEPTSDRASKRRALEHIKKEVFGKQGQQEAAFFRHVFGALHRPLLRCLSDSVESCRETSVGVTTSFATSMDDVTSFLPYIVPAIVARLDQPEIVEPAEEIRLLLVAALTRFVGLAEARFAPYVEECVKVLQRSFLDPFPDVKKESCQLVTELSKHCSRALAYHGATVAKAVIPAMQHRHSSVRCLALRAIRDAMIVDASALDDVLEPLRNLTLDKSQSVRESLYSTAGDWLLMLPDRWSIGYKILPLLLAGLTDDIQKSVALSSEYMDKIGKLYEEEWNDRVKDEMDYAQTSAPGRPRVGCRHLARENTQKIVNQMLEGMNDWNVDVRIKSAQILATFLRYCEEKITGYAGVILPALYKALATDEPAVASQALRVAELLGVHVEPDVCMEVLVPALKSGGGGATRHRIGCLRVLGGILRGTPPARLDAPRVLRLIGALQDRELMNNENTEVLAEVASAAAALAGVMVSVPVSAAAGPADEKCRLELFVLLAYLHSVNQDKSIPDNALLQTQCAEALSTLAAAHNVPAAQDLFALYFKSTLDRIMSTEESWTRYSPELRLLKTMTALSGDVLGKHLAESIPLFARMSVKDKDIEVRETVLDILLAVLAIRPTPLNSTLELPSHGPAILTQIVLPNGIWKPGRKAAALRNKTVRTLLAMLDAEPAAPQGCVGIFRVADLAAVWDAHLMAMLIGVLEDDDAAARKDILAILDRLLEALEFEAATFKTLYPELLKRLDDAHDDLRVAAATTWTSFFRAATAWRSRTASLQQAAPPNTTSILVDANGAVLAGDAAGAGGTLVEIGLDDVHWTAMAKGLTIHLDDPNPALQQAIFEALQASLQVAPHALLKDHLSSARARHRNPRYIDALLTDLGS